jgi:hypothetical protein
MRRRTLFCLLLAVLGCDAHSNSLVIIELSANAPLDGITALDCWAEAGGRKVSFTVEPPAGSGPFALEPAMQSFGIDLPRAVSGPIHVHVDAMGSGPQPLASGDADGVIKPEARLDLPLQLMVATAMPGKVTISPGSDDCGSSLIGTRSAKSARFTVTNSGDSKTGTPKVSTGDDGNPATQQFFASGCPSALGPGETCTITVAFTPGARGAQTTSVSVVADPGGQANATVNGSGLAAAAFTIAPQAGASATFAPQARGSTSAATTFVATNTGDLPSPLLSTPVTSDAVSFPVVANSCNNHEIPAGASCNIQVAFAPQSSTTVSTLLSVIALVNGPPAALGKLQLAGTGTPVWQQETPTVAVPGSFSSVWGNGPDQVFIGGPAGAILQRSAAGSVTWSLVSLNFPWPPDVIRLFSTTNPTTHAAQDYLISDGGGLLGTNAPPNWAYVTDVPAPVTGLFGFSTADLWTSSGDSSSSFYHWNGSAWITESSTVGGGINLWGTSDSDLFAYGSDLVNLVRHDIVLHRGASGTWTQQGAGELPSLPTIAHGVTGITSMIGFGTPANDVYALTAAGGLFHSNGDGHWAQVPNAPAGTQGPHTTCGAVFGVTPSAVWVACPGGVYLYDGVAKTWGTNGLVASGVTFTALWGSSPNDIYAVGTADAGVVYHYY